MARGVKLVVEVDGIDIPLDFITSTTGSETTYRIKTVLGDPEKAGHVANILTRGPYPREHDPAKFQHDLGVTDYRVQKVEDLLISIHNELKTINFHLLAASDIEEEEELD